MHVPDMQCCSRTVDCQCVRVPMNYLSITYEHLISIISVLMI